MSDQLSLFNQQSSSFPRKMLKKRGRCLIKYRNGARVNANQDRFGLFWLVRIDHCERTAFLTMKDRPEKGNDRIEKLIAGMAHF